MFIWQLLFISFLCSAICSLIIKKCNRGRVGLSIIKSMSQTVNTERRDFIISTRILHSNKNLNEDKIWITYEHTISKEICQEHVLDIIKGLDKES